MVFVLSLLVCYHEYRGILEGTRVVELGKVGEYEGPIGVKLACCVGGNAAPQCPTRGRPQGSHPLILTSPALTKKRNSQFPLRRLCKGGCGAEWDPCGRPGLRLLNLTPIGPL
jgi:hypothetical protein